MRDAWTFAVLWSFGVAALIALPLTAVIVRALVCGREPAGERRLRELYRLVLEDEIHGEQCFACRCRVEPEWLRCPACTTELRGRCRGCRAVVRLHWSTCPWCVEPLERLTEPEHVAVRVPDADLAHPPRPVGRRVDEVGAAVA